MAAFSSCRKEEPIIIDDGPTIQSVLITVEKNQWVYSNVPNNNFFYATVSMPEITDEIFKTGFIKMYRCFDFGSDNATQIEMPYVRHNEEYWSDEDYDIDGWDFYTETLDYEIQVGHVTICYTLSDFYYELDEGFTPDRMQFRCVVM